MDGIININKPKGYTSHDVVACIRRILDMKKVGHTGTLDPEATGVLPICVGRATKAAELLTAKDKQYVAEVTLGAETDTQDASGRVLRTAAVEVTPAMLEEAAARFTGEISQIPPMYSAVKQDGQRLYEIARSGREVERAPRKVEIRRLEILETDLEQNRFTMRVDCSKGTYIRTLCHDMGRYLKCFAHLSGLCRTASGRFTLDTAVTLEQTEAAVAAGDWSFLLPVDQVFEEFPSLYLSARKAERVRHGAQVSTPGLVPGETYRVYGEEGEFLAISAARDDGLLKILKSFY